MTYFPDAEPTPLTEQLADWLFDKPRRKRTLQLARELQDDREADAQVPLQNFAMALADHATTHGLYDDFGLRSLIVQVSMFQ